MAARTYKARGVVLRKRKLRESDAIVAFLDNEGELREAVAHGARRPGSTFAGRLELFSEVDIVCSKGRNLDVVSDCRLIEGSLRRFGMEQSISASAVAELLGVVAQPGLKQERLFELANSSFDAISKSDPSFAPVYAVAALLKICAITGLRPSFSRCVLCGEPVSHDADGVAFSCSEGGVLCGTCKRPYDSYVYDGRTMAWCDALLYSRYADIALFDDAPSAIAPVIEVARSWILAHVGYRMKSLDMLASRSFISGMERIEQ